MILPLVALSIPPKRLRIVVFPAPLGPNITTNSPFSIANDTLWAAVILTSPIIYSFFTFLSSM